MSNVQKHSHLLKEQCSRGVLVSCQTSVPNRACSLVTDWDPTGGATTTRLSLNASDDRRLGTKTTDHHDSCTKEPRAIYVAYPVGKNAKRKKNQSPEPSDTLLCAPGQRMQKPTAEVWRRTTLNPEKETPG